MSLHPVRPLPFDPAFEVIPDNEPETTAELVRTMRSISETTWHDDGRAVRSVHAKSHGLVVGELLVPGNLPPPYAQGVFARAAAIPVAMRFSTNPGDVLDDKVSTPRVLAIKLIGVEGERLPDSENDLTQDFVMINAPAFTAEGSPVVGAARHGSAGRETGRRERHAQEPGRAARDAHLGRDPSTRRRRCSMARTFAKLSVAPVCAPLTALTNAPVDLNDRPNGLRAAVCAFFAAHGGEWELRVQLASDIEKMPIEDASVRWPENESPYVAVARLRVSPQSAWCAARVAAIDEGMAFSPWHGIRAHRPLGGVIRSRKPAYEMSAHFRRERNCCPMGEPREPPAAHG